jgi:hypothetical protein
MGSPVKRTIISVLLINAIAVAGLSASEYANALQREHEKHMLYDVAGKPYVVDPSLKNRMSDYETAYARENMIPEYTTLYRDKDREAYTQLEPLPLAEQFLYTPQEYVTPEMAEKMAEAYEQWKPSRIGFEPVPELQRVYYDKPYGSSWRIPSWQRVKRNLGFETPRAEDYESASISREPVYGPRGAERDRELTAAEIRRIEENQLRVLGFIPEPIKEQTFWDKVKTVFSNLWSKGQRTAAYNELTNPYATMGEKARGAWRELTRRDYGHKLRGPKSKYLYPEGGKRRHEDVPLVLYPDSDQRPKTILNNDVLYQPTQRPTTIIVPEVSRPAQTLFPEQPTILPKGQKPVRTKKSTLY